MAKKAPKVAVKKGAAAKKDKKDPAQVEAEEKAAKEAEEQKKLKEAEAARKKAEEAARAAYKPKDYSSEEKTEWIKQKQDLEQFFSSIVMRQSNDAAPAEAPKEEGENAEEAPKEEGEDAEAAEPEQKIVYGKRIIREQSI